MADQAAPPAVTPVGADWSARPWLLAALLGTAGLLVHVTSGGSDPTLFAPWRAALTALVFFGALAFAFTLDRDRWRAPLVFAALVGAVMAGIAWRAASAGDGRTDEGFWIAAGVVAVALALPLFQAGFHRLRWRTSYREAHYHVWTDAISAGGALAFTGLAWAVTALLSELFATIEITLLRDLLDQGWFGWIFSGAAFGAALGTLRNQLRVIGTLQSVVLLVFSLIAVPLAAALLLFLLAVLTSGIDVLWAATRSATPLLLSFAAGSFVLVNAVLRDSDAETSGSRIMRGAALVLALGILPLAALASISMGTRIAQHGLSPERIWALVAIAVAVAFGIGYLVAVLRGRRAGWRDGLRQANLHLAAGTCVLALLLALPILDFGAISARNQVARLQAGAVAAGEFDYAALRWEFGDAGRAALAELAERGGLVGERARAAMAEETRYADQLRSTRREWVGGEPPLTFGFTDERMREWVERHVRSNPYLCPAACAAIDLGRDGGRYHVGIVTGQTVEHVYFRGDGVPFPPAPPPAPPATMGPDAALLPDSIEVRPTTRRQIYVDGAPVGQPFE